MSIKILQNKPFAKLKTEQDDLNWDADFQFDCGQQWDADFITENSTTNASLEKPGAVISIQSNKPILHI